MVSSGREFAKEIINLISKIFYPENEATELIAARDAELVREAKDELDSLKQQWNALQDYIHKTDFETRPREIKEVKEEMRERAAREIFTSCSATGGWLDSPKAVAAAIRALPLDPPAGKKSNGGLK